MAPNRLWEKPLLKPLNLVSQAPGMNFSSLLSYGYLITIPILFFLLYIDLKHIFCKMFVRSTQKNCQTMKRRSKASLKSIFTPTKRSAIVLLEVGLREKVATALSAPSATKHWEHLQLC
ncbi:uncharacterized protein LOC107643560 isoform X5 [Arachis ipaensis]|uniref:uncharacterized protein LOC107643560 isoform X5 n=1 Tax=Arachis ipaensis TaxID=130454 RepID=UPI000A2B551D|nr:uncharacterized protein LOC107643560 isoform X5 [Arachis ipaensis]XP_025654624.1 uncharacterized protein LOC112750224 isoform X5 [Arachis hypogaea]